LTAQNIFEETKKILNSEEQRSEMIAQFRRIKKILGEKTASQNAAQELEKLVKQKQDTEKRQLESK
jgi:lipid-A-disaccharide synthase